MFDNVLLNTKTDDVATVLWRLFVPRISIFYHLHLLHAKTHLIAKTLVVRVCSMNISLSTFLVMIRVVGLSENVTRKFQGWFNPPSPSFFPAFLLYFYL